MGRGCAWHVHQQWTGGAQIRVQVVEREPICGHPIIAGRSAEDWTGLEANYCFAAVPVSIGAKSVPGRARRGPCCYAGWIIDRDAHEPAMPNTEIPHTPISNIKNVAYNPECRSLLLGLRGEVDPVVCSCRLHVYGPAGIDVACVHVKGYDKMLLGCPAIRGDHCI